MFVSFMFPTAATVHGNVYRDATQSFFVVSMARVVSLFRDKECVKVESLHPSVCCFLLACPIFDHEKDGSKFLPNLYQSTAFRR
jgi:hypothetical protein